MTTITSSKRQADPEKAIISESTIYIRHCLTNSSMLVRMSESFRGPSRVLLRIIWDHDVLPMASTATKRFHLKIDMVKLLYNNER